MTVSIHVPAGHKLEVLSTEPTTGSVWEITDGVPGTPYAIPANGALGLGPFHNPRSYAIASVNGVLDVTVATTDDKPYSMQRSSLAGRRTEVVPVDHLMVIYGTFTVNGRLTVDGTLRVAALPSLT
jgi:hypothetical protein